MLPPMVATEGMPFGHLPAGEYPATLEEVKERFGGQTERRRRLYQNLEKVVELARRCGYLRIHIAGSFVTGKAEPGDVDVVIVPPFRIIPDGLGEDCRLVLDHDGCKSRYGVQPLMCSDASGLLGQMVEAWSRCIATKRLRGSIVLTL